MKATNSNVTHEGCGYICKMAEFWSGVLYMFAAPEEDTPEGRLALARGRLDITPEEEAPKEDAPEEAPQEADAAAKSAVETDADVDAVA